jgi:glutamine synthetase
VVGDGEQPSSAAAELVRGINDGSLREIEVAWSDAVGHAAGNVPDPFAPDTVNWSRDNRSAAVIAGLEADRRPQEAASGNLYGKGSPRPESLGTALALATQDDTILRILGTDSVLDFAAIPRSEWLQYQSHVSDWERRRYLASS